jgi:hypothetical protein
MNGRPLLQGSVCLELLVEIPGNPGRERKGWLNLDNYVKSALDAINTISRPRRLPDRPAARVQTIQRLSQIDGHGIRAVPGMRRRWTASALTRLSAF